MSDHVVIYPTGRTDPGECGYWWHYCTRLRGCWDHPRTRVLKDPFLGHWHSISPGFEDCMIFRTHREAINYATRKMKP